MWNRFLLLKAKLLGHEGIRRYGANTAWLMGEKVLRMFMGLFVGIWVARYLGPEQFGLLSYAQSFVFLFTAIATLGLDSIVVRELVKDNSQRNVLLGTAFTLKLIGSLCILPLLWFGVQFTSNDSYTNLLIFIIASGTIFQSFNVIDFYYQSSVLSKYVAFANTVTLAISSIIKIVLIMNEASLLAFAIVGMFDTVILSIGLIYFYWQKTQHSLREWQFDRVVAKRLLKDSWPLIISSVMVSLYMKIDQIMIKEMLDNNAVGQYAAAVRLIESTYFVPVIIVSSIFPSLVNIKHDKNKFNKRIEILYVTLFWASLLITAFLFANREWLVLTLFGSDYSESVKIFGWLSIMLPVVAISAVHGKWLLIENLVSFNLYYTFFAATLNVCLNIIFIPKYGSIGAVFATLCAQIIPYTLLLISRKTRNHLLLILNSIFLFNLISNRIKKAN